MIIDGVVIAGGAGTRMGGSKPLRAFGDTTLIEAVIARVRPQVTRLALNIPLSEESCYRAFFAGPLVFDEDTARKGPLAGILAGLNWLEREPGAEWLASFPSDTPFLPPDLVARLSGAAGSGRPAYIVQQGKSEPLCALWPRDARPFLRRNLINGAARSVVDALRLLNGVGVETAYGARAFFNVNTKDDLALAERWSTEP